MICSGRQTVVIRKLGPGDLATVEAIVKSLQRKKPRAFEISNLKFQIVDNTRDGSSCYFLKTSETEFVYQEKLGAKNELYIVGGGHCALALSEIAANLDFRVSIFDDRPELNTLEKNDFAHDIAVVDGYERIGEMIPDGENVYVVVMTLGYKFDEIVIRALAGRNFKYFGVLGSKAKMATLMNTLRNDGFPADWLAGIRTPIGLPINSHSPEEIAVSIAAEIIAVKNSEN
jgi:xanthine dehydrogenase accessory factor